jgi:hypothetical protein
MGARQKVRCQRVKVELFPWRDVGSFRWITTPVRHPPQSVWDLESDIHVVDGCVDVWVIQIRRRIYITYQLVDPCVLWTCDDLNLQGHDHHSPNHRDRSSRVAVSCPCVGLRLPVGVGERLGQRAACCVWTRVAFAFVRVCWLFLDSDTCMLWMGCVSE